VRVRVRVRVRVWVRVRVRVRESVECVGMLALLPRVPEAGLVEGVGAVGRTVTGLLFVRLRDRCGRETLTA
jgi:hypothetical protein